MLLVFRLLSILIQADPGHIVAWPCPAPLLVLQPVNLPSLPRLSSDSLAAFSYVLLGFPEQGHPHLLGHEIYLWCLIRQILICVPDISSQNLMGSVQSLFLSSVAVILTQGTWEMLLRHLKFAPPRHPQPPATCLLCRCAPRGSLPSGHKSWPVVRASVPCTLNAVAARPSAAGEP